METATYTASLRTREAKSSSNHSNSTAYQEFYTKGKNYIGIIHFTGLSLKNMVITGVSLTVTAGLCLITCDTYVGDELVGTKSCAVTLTVPASIVPSISDVTFSEAAAGIAEQF